MKAHIPISIYEWVESYGLTQYILFITNKSNQLSSEKITIYFKYKTFKLRYENNKWR
jgi:hypothetical protein